MTTYRQRRRAKTALAIAIACSSVAGAIQRPAAAQCSYEILAIIEGQPCGFGGNVSMRLYGLNDDLLAVGREGQCPDQIGRPVYWSPETGLVRPEPPVLGNDWNGFTDVNARGLMVGTFDFVGPMSLGVVYDGSEWSFLASSPDGGACNASFVNDDGVVAGSRDIEVEPGVTIRAAYRWTEDGGYEDLIGEPLDRRRTITGLAPDGTVLGFEGFAGSPLHDIVPFLWHPDGTVTTPDVPRRKKDERLFIGAANAVGEFIALVRGDQIEDRIGLMTAQGFVELEIDPQEAKYAVRPLPRATNVLGVSTGRTLYESPPSPFYHSAPLLYRDGSNRRLRDLVIETDAPMHGGPGFAGPTAVLDEAAAITDSGLIAAWGNVGQGLVSLVLRPVHGSPADLTGDCRVSIDDLLRLLERWGRPPVFADLDGDGAVGFGDLLTMLNHWG